MTEEQFESVKKSYVEHIQQYIKDVGNLFPHITIFAEHKDKEANDKPAIIHIPIPDEFMQSDKMKDQFLEDHAPDIFKTVKEDFIPTGVAWGAEAWVRKVSNQDEIPEDYRDIPIQKEVVFVSIETKDKQETIIYDINRNGKQVNPGGSITDMIELTEAEESRMNAGVTGRFTGLFKMLEKA
jgi:hypothetical protein